MWQGKRSEGTSSALSVVHGRRSAPAPVDQERGVFVSSGLAIGTRGVEDWEAEARAHGAADDREGTLDPQSAYVEQVLAECSANADGLKAEALSKLHDFRADAINAIQRHLEARKLAAEAEYLRAKRWNELNQIDPRVGRFGEFSRWALLTFGFVLEAVLIWLATYRVDFTANERLIAALIVGGLITGVLHVLARYLTQQVLRKPGKLGTAAILGAGGLMLTCVIILLTVLAEIRKSDFPVLAGDGLNVASFQEWLFWALLMISVLGTMSATIAGVAHGLEAPLRDAQRALKKAKSEAKNSAKELRDAYRERLARVDDLNQVTAVYVDALGTIPDKVAVRIGNAFLDAQGLGHTVRANYAEELADLESHVQAHVDALMKGRADIDATLLEAEQELSRDLAGAETTQLTAETLAVRIEPETPATGAAEGVLTT